MPSREQYVAQRIGARFASRGEHMILRRTTLSSGPVPYRNPPDTSLDLVVVTGVTLAGQAYLGIQATNIIGRLVAGDQILCSASPTGPVLTTWTVGVMPPTVATDVDGIVEVDGAGVPILGTPTPYRPDSRARETDVAGDKDFWPAVPVTAPGNPDPAASVGNVVKIVYQADQICHGNPLSFSSMTANGWLEVNTIGVRLAAYKDGPILPPKIDDLLFIGDKIHSIMTVGQLYSNGVQFAYDIQAR